MSVLDKVKAMRGGQAPAAGKPAVKGKKGSRWGAVGMPDERDPFPWTGLGYIFRVLAVTMLSENGESYRATLEIVEQNLTAESQGSPGQQRTKVGDRVIFLQKLDSADAWRMGAPRIKAFTLAVAGVEDVAVYDREDPDGLLIDAGSGELNEAYDHNPLIGRFVVGDVLKGKDRDDGDFYRNYRWEVLPEELQAELAAKLGPVAA